ncbi:MAG: 4'-phosphopantetheinyl transferase superfamily protein [Pseudomonadota bacterium]
MWGGFLPEGVALACADPRERPPGLMPEEAAQVAAAVPRRQQEFAHGRALARRLLGQLGIENFALLIGPHREPRWPAGVVGSVTHTETLCAVAVAPGSRYAGLGIDLEPDEPLEPELAVHIATPGELAETANAGLPDPGVGARLVFSAKEAVYKCQFPATGRRLAFADVTILLEAGGTFRIKFDRDMADLAPAAALEGRWMRGGGLLFTAAWWAYP